LSSPQKSPKKSIPDLLHLSSTLLHLLHLYSLLLHLQPLRFHWVRGCWDRTQGVKFANTPCFHPGAWFILSTEAILHKYCPCTSSTFCSTYSMVYPVNRKIIHK
jgi:hypothetical protein